MCTGVHFYSFPGSFVSKHPILNLFFYTNNVDITLAKDAIPLETHG